MSGEIVREQTVRARLPTQRYSAPGEAALGSTALGSTAPAPVVSGETVRAPMPTAPDAGVPLACDRDDTPAAPMLLDEPGSLELDEVELVEELVEPGSLRRDDPPAASGEVVVAPEPEPEPSPRTRPTTLPSGQVPEIGRADPAPVAGEVQVQPGADAIEHAGMGSSGPQPMMGWPGGRRPSTDPGSFGHAGLGETTGPQPRAQGETTGPHAVAHGMRPSADASTNTTLWIVAGALVLLAMTVLGFVLTW